MNLRHEQKAVITPNDVRVLRTRLSAIMKRDPHASPGGSYLIRSLYFENLSDKALREKLDGTDPREKFRIRYYDHDISYLILEKKRKIRDLTEKTQQVLTIRETVALLKGDLPELLETEKPLLRELVSKMQYEGLRPHTIVDYTREPFIYAPGNVRVTLDTRIRTGMLSTAFLDTDAVMIPAGDIPAILEVKWDAFLPEIIRDAVRVPGTHMTSYSKYQAARIYG
ncbi:MAG: polyphosphate polymerase domain-containing protein [Lachnospiraceae bacterium]|nr:polyphosphate polymerase domain-containing protein [Lachnospiraceae bacterium]